MTSKKKSKEAQASSSLPRRPSVHKKSWDISPEGIDIQLSEENVKTFSEKFWAFPVSWEWPSNSSSHSPKEDVRASRNSGKSVSSLVRSALERRKKKTNQEAHQVNLSQSVAAATVRDESKDLPPFPRGRDDPNASDFVGYFKEWRKWMRDSDTERIPAEFHGRRKSLKDVHNNTSPAPHTGERDQSETSPPGHEQRSGSSDTVSQNQMPLNYRNNSLDSDNGSDCPSKEGKNTNTKPELPGPKQPSQASRTTSSVDSKIKKERILPTAHAPPERTNSTKWQFSNPQFPSIRRATVTAPRHPRRYVDCATPVPDIQAKLPGIPSLQAKLPELKNSRSKYLPATQADLKKREELPAIRRRDTDLPKIK